jgi:hypothetical protein
MRSRLVNGARTAGCWLALACLIATLNPSVAAAATLTLASAEMGVPGQAIGPSVSATNFVGWRFSVGSTTAVTEVGGHLGGISGNLFAAIITLPAIDSLPQGAPFAEGTVKASTSFAPPNGSNEFRIPLATTLAPGAYALVFGSGLFNASGTALAATSGQPNIAPTTQASYVFWRQTLPNIFNWTVGTSNNIRFTVIGSEIAGATDFNLDGVVDANDLPVWKAGYGGTAPAGIANGDANDDNIVDGADFLAWQRSVAAAATMGAAPEPSSALLGAIAAAALGRCASLGRRRCAR